MYDENNVCRSFMRESITTLLLFIQLSDFMLKWLHQVQKRGCFTK